MQSPDRGDRSEPPTDRSPSNSHATSGTLGAVVTAAAIAVVFVGFLLPLPTYNPDARTLPLVVGVPATVLALINVVRQYREWRQARRERKRQGVPIPDVATRLRGLVTPREGDATSVSAAIGWVVGGTVSVLVLGFLWGAIVFMPAFMFLYGKERVTSVLLYAGGLLLVLYVVFILGFDVPYFPGLFND